MVQWTGIPNSLGRESAYCSDPGSSVDGQGSAGTGDGSWPVASPRTLPPQPDASTTRDGPGGGSTHRSADGTWRQQPDNSAELGRSANKDNGPAVRDLRQVRNRGPWIPVRDVAAQEAGGGRRPDDHVDAAAFGSDAGSSAGRVEVFHVEGEDFGCSGGGLIASTTGSFPTRARPGGVATHRGPPTKIALVVPACPLAGPVRSVGSCAEAGAWLPGDYAGSEERRQGGRFRAVGCTGWRRRRRRGCWSGESKVPPVGGPAGLTVEPCRTARARWSYLPQRRSRSLWLGRTGPEPRRGPRRRRSRPRQPG